MLMPAFLWIQIILPLTLLLRFLISLSQASTFLLDLLTTWFDINGSLLMKVGFGYSSLIIDNLANLVILYRLSSASDGMAISFNYC